MGAPWRGGWRLTPWLVCLVAPACTPITGLEGDAGTDATRGDSGGVVSTDVWPRDTPPGDTPPGDMGATVAMDAPPACLPTAADHATAQVSQPTEIFNGTGVHLRGSLIDHLGRRYAYGGTVVGTNARAFVVRLTSAGRLDTSFGAAGSVVIGSSDRTQGMFAMSMREDPRGRLVLAGAHTVATPAAMHGWVARIDDTGQLDPSFGASGSVEIAGPSSSDACFNDLWVDADRIVVVGGDQNQFAVGSLGLVAALDNDGAPDPTFHGGQLLVDYACDRFSAVRPTPGGDGVLVGGTQRLSTGVRAVRFRHDGVPDARYGDGGVAVNTVLTTVNIRAMAVEGDGSAVFGGEDAQGRAALLRIDPLGHADLGFGRDGVYATYGAGWNVGYALQSSLVRECDGSLVIAVSDSGGGKLFRVAPDGRSDAFFGGTGTTPGRPDQFVGVAIDPRDGTIVAAAGVNGAVADHMDLWTLRP